MIKEKLTKTKRAMFAKKKKFATAMTGAIAAIAATGLPVLADPVSINEDPGEMSDVAGGIAGVILDVFKYIGIILGIWGVGQLVLAFRNDDADSKTRAVMLIIAAIALIGLKTLLETAGFIN